MVHLSKTVCGIFDFRFRLVFIKFYIKLYIFVQHNAWALWLNVIIPFKIKVIEKPLAVLLPDLWFLSCNKKFENLMISVWVGAPQKNSPGDFGEHHFFSIVTFKQIFYIP